MNVGRIGKEEWMKPNLTLPYLTLPYLALPCLTLPHLTLLNLILPYLILSYFILSYITLPYLTLPTLLPFPSLPFPSLPFPSLPLICVAHWHFIRITFIALVLINYIDDNNMREINCISSPFQDWGGRLRYQIEMTSQLFVLAKLERFACMCNCVLII